MVLGARLEALVVGREHAGQDDLTEDLARHSFQQRATRGSLLHVHAKHHDLKEPDPHPVGAGPDVHRCRAVGDRQAPRRALSPSSSVHSTAGSPSPNFSNHSVIWGISFFHSSTSTSSAAFRSSSVMSRPSMSSEPGAGT